MPVLAEDYVVPATRLRWRLRRGSVLVRRSFSEGWNAGTQMPRPHVGAHRQSPMAQPFANTASRSRGGFRPRLAIKFLALQSEGAGNAGRAMRPQPRVQ